MMSVGDAMQMDAEQNQVRPIIFPAPFPPSLVEMRARLRRLHQLSLENATLKAKLDIITDEPRHSVMVRSVALNWK